MEGRRPLLLWCCRYYCQHHEAPIKLWNWLTHWQQLIELTISMVDNYYYYCFGNYCSFLGFTERENNFWRRVWWWVGMDDTVLRRNVRFCVSGQALPNDTKQQSRAHIISRIQSNTIILYNINMFCNVRMRHSWNMIIYVKSLCILNVTSNIFMYSSWNTLKHDGRQPDNMNIH